MTNDESKHVHRVTTRIEPTSDDDTIEIGIEFSAAAVAYGRGVTEQIMIASNVCSTMRDTDANDQQHGVVLMAIWIADATLKMQETKGRATREMLSGVPAAFTSQSEDEHDVIMRHATQIMYDHPIAATRLLYDFKVADEGSIIDLPMPPELWPMMMHERELMLYTLTTMVMNAFVACDADAGFPTWASLAELLDVDEDDLRPDFSELAEQTEQALAKLVEQGDPRAIKDKMLRASSKGSDA
jgi:hypothetical protein